MMVYTKNLILVCTGRDTTKAASLGMPVLLQGIYSAARIAAFLQPVSQDFTLPSPTPNGISLSAAARAALLAQTGAQPFFSRELCAKYFTYMNADGQAHFVLYDDDSTLAAKLAQLAGCGVQNVFALFPDAAGLLKPQT